MGLPLAVALAHARLTGHSIDESEVTVPETASTAYEIQDRLIELVDQPVVGWKIGATSEATRRRLGLKAPIAGPVFASTLFESGCEAAVDDFHHPPGIECEFVLRVAKPPEACRTRYDESDARRIVDGVSVGIELVNTRFDGNLDIPPALLVADGSAHSALVVAEPGGHQDPPDLTDAECHAICDGEERLSGTAADVLGGPYNALAWLMNHLRGRGHELEPGMLIATGTCTGILPSALDLDAAADAGAIGRATVRFR